MTIPTTLLILISIGCSGHTHAIDSQQANDATVQLVDGLRQRRLFSFAETACRDALKIAAEDSAGQATLVIELIQIQIDQAAVASNDRQNGCWNAARKTASEFLIRHPQHPQRVLVEVQLALTDLAHANLISQASGDQAASELARAAALAISQRARSRFKSIEATVAEKLQDARHTNISDNALPEAKLQNLQRNLKFQLAQCGFNRAGLYTANDPLNRTSALNEVASQLSELQRLNQPGEPLWWQTQLALVKCCRLLQQYDAAQSSLDRIASDDLKTSRSAWIADLLIQRIDLLIEDGTSGESLFRQSDLLLAAVDRTKLINPEMDIASVRLLVKLVNASGLPKQQQELLSQGRRRIALIEQQHGGWWARRANNILASGVTASLLANSATPAEVADTTSKLVSDALQEAQAIEAAGQNQLAGVHMTELAVQFQQHPQAASIHLRGCWNVGLAMSKSADARASFVAALQDHLQRWPTSPTRNQVRLWLGKHQLAQQQWEVAAETLRQVDRDSPHRGAAMTHTINAIDRAILKSANSPEDARNSAVEWIKRLESTDTALDAIANLGSLELRLLHDPNNAATSLKSLRQMLVTNPPVEIATKACVLVVPASILSRTASADFAESLSNLKKYESATAFADCLRILERVEQAVSTDRIGDLRRSQLACLVFLTNHTDGQPQKNQRLFQQAKVLSDLDRHSEALPILQSLVEQNPRDARLRLQQARTMTRLASSATRQQQALNTWRALARQLKPQTPGWYEAKYNTAQLLLETGQVQQAITLLNYVAALPSGWQESELASQFALLLKRCHDR